MARVAVKFFVIISTNILCLYPCFVIPDNYHQGSQITDVQLQIKAEKKKDAIEMSQCVTRYFLYRLKICTNLLWMEYN